jgi:hypothetical protein
VITVLHWLVCSSRSIVQLRRESSRTLMPVRILRTYTTRSRTPRTCTATTQSTLSTVRPAHTASFCSTRTAWTSKSTTVRPRPPVRHWNTMSWAASSTFTSSRGRRRSRLLLLSSTPSSRGPPRRCRTGVSVSTSVVLATRVGLNRSSSHIRAHQLLSRLHRRRPGRHELLCGRHPARDNVD